MPVLQQSSKTNKKAIVTNSDLFFKLPSLSYATSEFLRPHLPDFTGVGDKLATFDFGSYSLKNESSGANEIARCPRAGCGGAVDSRNADGLNGGTLVALALLSFGPKHY